MRLPPPNRLFVIIIVVLILSGCASKQIKSIDKSPLPKTSAIERFNQYRLGNGDVLDIIYQVRPQETNTYALNIQDKVEIRFPSMPEHNIEQVIRPDGKITLPYIDDVYILGMTTEEATLAIREKYKDVLRLPSVFILIKEFGSGTRELKRVITTASRGQSKLITIRPDGIVTLPLIGDQLVRDLTLTEASLKINTAYKKIYPELQVDVILHESAGAFIYVVGQVQKPGAYKINNPSMLRIMLAMAGGVTNSARLDNVIVSRRNGDVMEYRIVDLDDTSSAITMLIADDIIYVPRTRLTSSAQIAREISEVTFFRGFSLGFSWVLHDED